MNNGDFIAISAILFALIVNFIQIIDTKEQIKLQTFSDYTKRYQDIILHLPLDIFKEGFELETLSVIEKKYLRTYFDLCSEEYYLHIEDKIEKKVWKEWKDGILENLNMKNMKDFISTNCIRPESYSEFINFLNENTRTT